MKDFGKRKLFIGLVFIITFAIFTWLVQVVDVKPLGVNGTDIGFSFVNCALHRLCGVNMALYTVTDWLGLVPIAVAAAFGIVGLVQLVRRKSFLKVDSDILVLGVYYMAVFAFYITFEMVSVNYRPILINGFMETSYPSSTTLLVLCVMPTLSEQISRRCKHNAIKTAVSVLTIAFSAFMVVGRLLSGVHWFTDILGSVLLGIGLFHVYKGFVSVFNKKP